MGNILGRNFMTGDGYDEATLKFIDEAVAFAESQTHTKSTRTSCTPSWAELMTQ